MGKDPANAGKYIVRNSFMSSGALIFFIYGMYKMGNMESKMTQKYLGEFTFE
jgi:hypothetical protein